MEITATLGVVISLLGFLTSSQAESRVPPVYLNHFYIVVDSTTYKEIEQSQFLRREFAVTEQRTTVRTDMSYTGLYFYGTNTYFEFFDESGNTFNQAGISGIALGVDRSGELQAIAKELSSSFSLDQKTITRLYNGKQVPWFSLGGPKDFSRASGLDVWLMEYLPRFLGEWNPHPGGPDQAVSRREILHRYAAVLKDVPRKPYFEDVVALTIAMNEANRKNFTELCKRLGYSERTVGDATELKGPGIEFRVLPQTEESRGIREITMRVTRKPKDQTEFRLGKSVLRFRGDGLATWSF